MKIVDLAIADGTFPMPAHLVGLLAVHRLLTSQNSQGQTFVVTHVPSGKLICRVGKFPKAMKVARALAKLKGWERKDEDIKRDKAFRNHVRELLRGYDVHVSLCPLTPAPERGMR